MLCFEGSDRRSARLRIEVPQPLHLQRGQVHTWKFVVLRANDWKPVFHVDVLTEHADLHFGSTMDFECCESVTGA
jgi:hypothetical protein